jgi:polygalacturonase
MADRFPHGLNILEFEEYSFEGKDWTEAFRRAVDALQKAGGGTVVVPAGFFPTRSIRLKSNITLALDSGADLYFKDDYESFEIVDTEFEGAAVRMYMPLIFAEHAENIAVTGHGTINGNGARAWREKASLPYKRPYLICFQYCDRVRIADVTLKNSPVWSVHPLYCNNVDIHGISITNPADSPNTDGINPDGCSNVRISGCLIDVGDDCIAIKAGTEQTPEKRPCENIMISNCNMLHGHGGVVLGSEMSGCIRKVTVADCIFRDTDRGIRLKTRRGRGGAIEMLSFNNISMDKVLCPFSFNMYYQCGANEEDMRVWDKKRYPVEEGTPSVRDILISNMTVTRAASAAGFLYGLPERYIENVTFSNCSISMDPEGKPGIPDMLRGVEPMKRAGFFLRNAENIVFHKVRISGTAGEAIDQDASVKLCIKD